MPQSPIQERLEDAIVHNSPAEIDAALRAGASLTGERCWPLKRAVEFDALASMNHLLSIGHTMRAEWPQLDYCSREDMRETALHEAAFLNRPAMVRRLLEADGKHFINVAGPEFTAVPLALAAMVGAVEIVDILLAAGADVNARNADYAGKTALDYAVERDRLDIASKLLTAGADPD
ncbi:MAG: ankyrin repeat domain-containing protein, partial [Phycisphaerae bacterium]